MQGTLWILAGAFVVVAAIAALADRRRNSRRDIENVGWMPWPLIVILAVMLALACTAFAIHE